MTLPACETCGGKRHVLGDDGAWRRCGCLNQDSLFIKRELRGDLDRLPVECQQWTPLTFSDHTIGGNPEAYRAFRLLCWRSLQAERDSGLLYDVLYSWRLVDISFERDSLYTHVRQVQDLDLLILILGMASAPNKLKAPLTAQIVQLRRDAGKPTWVFCPYTNVQLRQEYDPVVAALVGPPVPAVPSLEVVKEVKTTKTTRAKVTSTGPAVEPAIVIEEPLTPTKRGRHGKRFTQKPERTKYGGRRH